MRILFSLEEDDAIALEKALDNVAEPTVKAFHAELKERIDKVLETEKKHSIKQWGFMDEKKFKSYFTEENFWKWYSKNQKGFQQTKVEKEDIEKVGVNKLIDIYFASMNWQTNKRRLEIVIYRYIEERKFKDIGEMYEIGSARASAIAYEGTSRAIWWLRKTLTWLKVEEEVKNNDYSNVPIEHCCFSNFTYFALQRNGFTTVGDICKKTADQMLGYPRLTLKNVLEVKEWLNEHDLHFAEEKKM